MDPKLHRRPRIERLRRLSHGPVPWTAFPATCRRGGRRGSDLRGRARGLLELGELLEHVRLLHLADDVMVRARERLLGRDHEGWLSASEPCRWRRPRESPRRCLVHVLLDHLRPDDRGLGEAVEDELDHVAREHELLDLAEHPLGLVEDDDVLRSHDHDHRRGLEGLDRGGPDLRAAVDDDEREDVDDRLVQLAQAVEIEVAGDRRLDGGAMKLYPWGVEAIIGWSVLKSKALALCLVMSTMVLGGRTPMMRFWSPRLFMSRSISSGRWRSSMR